LVVQRPDTEHNTKIRMVDMQGRVVRESILSSESDGSQVINLAGLPKGVYLVEINHGANREVKRLIVN
jgi:hypothetical protein